MKKVVVVWIVALAFAGAAGAAAAGGCPAAPQILATLSGLDLESAARTVRFDTPPPVELYRKAAEQIGRPFAARDGLKGTGAVIVERPIETLWKALIDEDHHDLGEFLPLGHSELVAGTPRDSSRLLFQRFQKWGFGRWWVVRTQSSAELYRSSGGRLWEIAWIDAFGDDGFEPSPEQTARTGPIEASKGAWLLARLAERCTLVEHFSHTKPGGSMSVIQRLVVRRAIRQSLTGMVDFADRHATSASFHPPGSFVRPDGGPLSDGRTAAAPGLSD